MYSVGSASVDTRRVGDRPIEADRIPVYRVNDKLVPYAAPS